MKLNRTSLPDDAAELTGNALSETLIDLIDLSLQGKQAHWNVVGSRFKTVHEHLDELVESTRAFADTVAERLVTIGQPAIGAAGHVDHHSKIDPFPTTYVKDAEAVKLVAERLGEVTGRLRDRIGIVSERDPVTEDVFVEVLRKLEEQMWMFHAQLQ